MDFSYIKDNRWKDLDLQTQNQMISLGFEQEVKSDSRFQELDVNDQNAMAQMYHDQAQQVSADLISSTEVDSEPGVFETIGKGLAHGAHGLVESAGTATEYLGQRVGSDTLVDVGQATKKVYGDFAKEYKPSAAIAGKNVWDNPELLKNSEYWLYNVSDMVPMLAASIVPGAGATKALSLAGAAPKLAMLGGSIIGGGFGGALEGTQTYNAVLAKGGTEVEAARSAELMTAGAGVLNALSVGKVLDKAGTGFKAKVIKTLGASAWEGITEGLEEPVEVFSKYLGSYLAGEPLPKDLEAQLVDSAKAALTVAPIAALTGGGGSIVSDLTYKPSIKIQEATTVENAIEAAEQEIDLILPGETPPEVEIPGLEADQWEQFMADELARQPIARERVIPKVPVDTGGYVGKVNLDPKILPREISKVPVSDPRAERKVPIIPLEQPLTEPGDAIGESEGLRLPKLEEVPVEVPIIPKEENQLVEPPLVEPQLVEPPAAGIEPKKLVEPTEPIAEIVPEVDPEQLTVRLNKELPGNDLKYDGIFDQSALGKPPLHQFTPQTGPLSGRTFTVKELTSEAVKTKISEMVPEETTEAITPEAITPVASPTVPSQEDTTVFDPADPVYPTGKLEQELFEHERNKIYTFLDSRKESIQGAKNPSEREKSMLAKVLKWQEEIASKTVTDIKLQKIEAEVMGDLIITQREKSGLAPLKQFQVGDRKPGEGVSLKDIQGLFAKQKVFISKDKEVSVVFDNGQGITINQIKDFENGDKEIAFQSGQMSSEGIIFGMTENNKITLNKNFADLETLTHEMTHTLKNLGILTPKDEHTLFLELNKLSQAGKFRSDRSTMKDKVAARDEDLANVLAQVLTDRKAYAGTKLGKIIQKIMDFIDSLMSFGEQTTRKLATEVESGKIFGRKAKQKTPTGTAFSAVREDMPMFATSEDKVSNQPFDVAEGSTKGETTKYALIDVLDPVKKVQTAIGSDKITEKEDYLLNERLRRNKQGAQITKAEKNLIQPIVDLMSDNGYHTDNVDEALYGRHAPEANKRLRLTNARRFLLDLAETHEKDYLQEKIEAIDEVMQSTEMKKLGLENSVTQKLYLELLRKELQYTISTETKAIAKEWAEKSEKFSGITDAEAAEINIKWSDEEDMQAIMKLTDKITSATLKISFDSGRITQDEYDAFKNTFKHYVPLFREGHTSQSGLFGTGQGIVNLGKDYKIRGGSSAKAINMLGNVLIQHEQAIRRAGKAEAGRTFLKLVKAYPNKDFWRVSEKTLINAYDPYGNLYKKEDYKIEPNDIPLKLDGKYYIISMNTDNIHAMRIAQHLKGSDVQTGWIVHGLSRFNRLLANVYTGLNPEFILTNPVRDIQIAAVNLSSTEIKDMTLKVLKDVPKAFLGMQDAIRGDATTEWGKIAKEAEEAGMLMSWSEQGQDVEKLAKNINRDVRLQQKNLKANVAKTVMKIGKLIKDYNMIAENMTRLSAYKNARDVGMSKAKAALLGKELTVNFEQKGLYGEIYNSLYLFSSAGVQGSTRLISGLIKSSKARKLVGGLMVSAMGVAITNGLFGGDDEEGKNNYANVADYDKERNMIFIVPNSKGKLIKIPLGWGLNFFWNIGTEIGDAILASMEPKKFKYDLLDGAGRLLNAGLNAFNPIQSSTLLQAVSPTITDPIVQVAENKTFSGAPLRPEKNKFADVPTPESQRYWKSVRPTSKAAAEWMNSITGGDKVEKGKVDISPEVLDLILDTYTGGLGKFAEGMVGLPKTLQEDELDVKKIPIVRRFIGTTNKNKGRSDYYDNSREVKMLQKKIKTYPERRREFMKDPLFKLSAYLKSTERQISALRKIVKNVKAEKSKARINDRIKKLQDKFNKRFEGRIDK